MKRLAKCFLAMLLLCFFGACSNEQRVFYQLQEARREDDRARPLAAELAKTSKGVGLALADMNVFGGTTRGWSSWILTETALSAEVEPKLKAILSDRSAEAGRRLEAANIMWTRTGETIYLENLFEMVRNPGDIATEWGRRTLSTSINQDELVHKLTVTPAESIVLTSEEFRLLIKEPGTLRSRSDK